jgi:hypothetical protein
MEMTWLQMIGPLRSTKGAMTGILSQRAKATGIVVGSVWTLVREKPGHSVVLRKARHCKGAGLIAAQGLGTARPSTLHGAMGGNHST